MKQFANYPLWWFFTVDNKRIFFSCNFLFKGDESSLCGWGLKFIPLNLFFLSISGFREIQKLFFSSSHLSWDETTKNFSLSIVLQTTKRIFFFHFSLSQREINFSISHNCFYVNFLLRIPLSEIKMKKVLLFCFYASSFFLHYRWERFEFFQDFICFLFSLFRNFEKIKKFFFCVVWWCEREKKS